MQLFLCAHRMKRLIAHRAPLLLASTFFVVTLYYLLLSQNGGSLQLHQPLGKGYESLTQNDPEPSATHRPTSDAPAADRGKQDRRVDFAKLRERWISTLTGLDATESLGDNQANPLVSAVLAQLSQNSQDLLDSMELAKSRIWPDLRPLTAGDNFRTSYERLLAITLSYSIKGTKHYQDTTVLQNVIHSLDVISKTAYNASTKRDKDENWWNFRIGAPLHLMDISILLHDEIGVERRSAYADTVVEFVGNLFENALRGANRVDICSAVVGASLLIDDEYILSVGRDCFLDRFKKGKNSALAITRKGDGFREDGSYISHDIYAYAGGYGVEHMVVVAKVAKVLHGTVYSFPSSALLNIYKAVKSTFLPVMFRGMMMGHARGRDITRMPRPDSFMGNLLLKAVLHLADIAPYPYDEEFKAICRRWNDQTVWPDMSGMNVSQAVKTWKIIKEKIPPSKPLRGVFTFPQSDRVVYHADGWVAAIAMSSKRIGRYEALNNENLRPWYQGDGMLYLYTENDPLHYSNDYWPTMDPFHTPGVTNGQNSQKDPVYKTKGYNDWAGGVKWAHPANGADYGTASLDHLSADEKSAARKSWYFFSDAVIALGADCAGISGTELHTTIESRNMPAPGEQLRLNGEVVSSSANSTVEKRDARWAHIENLGGYVFLDGQGATFTRELRTGSWRDVNAYPDYAMFDLPVTREYLSIIRNHGVDPSEQSYAYALLPGASAEATNAFSNKPKLSILENSKNLQAVSLNGNRTYLATFWHAGKVGALEAKTPCSAIWGYESEKDDTYTLSLSQPSQKSRKVEATLDPAGLKSVLRHDKTVTVKFPTNEGDHIKIIVNTYKSKGRTHSVTFKRG